MTGNAPSTPTPAPVHPAAYPLMRLFLLLCLVLPAFHALAAPQPLELRLIFRDTADGATTVAVRCPGLDIDTAPRPFVDPLAADPLALSEIRWYLESYTAWPVGPFVDRARRIEAGLPGIGRRLFQAAIGDEPEALRLWQQFLDHKENGQPPPKLLTVDSSNPEIQRLPWELLADERAHLFALNIPVRRRVHDSKRGRTGHGFGLPLRILMAVSRPDDLDFIDPRTASRALLDAVAELDETQVQVEFLPRATFAEISQRLRDGASGTKPPVHVLHFDGHGKYDPEIRQGLLAFEDGHGHADPVDADRIGQLMVNAQTPLLLLDACQSAAMDAKDPFRGVAPRLVEAGAGAVVAMPYSVHVRTSEVFFRGFFRALVAGNTIGQAVDQGRWALFGNPNRDAVYYPPDKKVKPVTLRDWFLPALYQRGGDPAPLAAGAGGLPAAVEEKNCHFLEPRFSENLLGGFPKPPNYCFVGRARALRDLQRHLARRQVVVLHGLAGQGKTALASEAARWLLRTGHFRKAVFVSFEGGGDVDLALGKIGEALVGEQFASLPRAARLPRLQAVLAGEPVLLVWDNFESVLPGWEAALPEGELRALLQTGLDLTGGGSRARLLITTREPKLARHHSDYGPSPRVAYQELAGMAVFEALKLAGSVLDARGLPRPERDKLEDLLAYLGGHPLSVLLVVPHLAEYGNDVDQVIRRFEELYPGFTQGEAATRNDSLKVSLGFSLARLGAAARQQLPVLGAFSQGAMEFSIPMVAEMDGALWVREGRALMMELEQAGLVTSRTLAVSQGALRFLAGEAEPPRDSFAQNTAIRFYRFHPTLAPHLARNWKEDARQRYPKRHRRFYYALANNLYLLDARDPHSARALAEAELPNLRAAVAGMFEAGEPDAVAFATYVERFLNHFGRWRQRDALLAKLPGLTDGWERDSEGPLTKAMYLALSQRGDRLLDQGRPHEAERLFRGLLSRFDRADYEADEVGYDRATTLSRLGRSLEAQGKLDAAVAEYRRALAALAGLDQAKRHVRRQTAVTHTDLADALTDAGYYRAARDQYEQGLAIDEALGDDRGAAVSNFQLGTLALVQGDYREAEQRYRAALERFRALAEPRSIATIHHQLGVVAETASEGAEGEAKARLLAEAEERYRESLRLKERMGDPAGAARSANQLGLIAEVGGRPVDAERWYRKALELDEAAGNPKALARDYNNLAGLLTDVHRRPAGQRPDAFAGRDLLTQAEALAHQAREIWEGIGDPSLGVWKTYGILADIAEARGDAREAATWRTKSEAAHRAFPGNR
uniref:Tetratricopeptide repeat-containing protein n=1 Tax=Candidatus Kentrum sp. DK TaxID=2126562 RepID=A0A450S793_9GAMM|nr:MAG: Tetratricopeptide repeat-containing protein [Candidatus Kentron sp. DK]